MSIWQTQELVHFETQHLQVFEFLDAVVYELDLVEVQVEFSEAPQPFKVASFYRLESIPI